MKNRFQPRRRRTILFLRAGRFLWNFRHVRVAPVSSQRDRIVDRNRLPVNESVTSPQPCPSHTARLLRTSSRTPPPRGEGSLFAFRLNFQAAQKSQSQYPRFSLHKINNLLSSVGLSFTLSRNRTWRTHFKLDPPPTPHPNSRPPYVRIPRSFRRSTIQNSKILIATLQEQNCSHLIENNHHDPILIATLSGSSKST